MQNVPAKQLAWDDANTAEHGQEASFDILGMVWRRKLLILLGLATGLGIGYLYYSQAPVIYETRGQVLITTKTPTGSSQSVDGIFQEVNQFTGHHKTMVSPVFVREVVKNKQIASLSTFHGMGEEEIIRKMINHTEPSLSVRPDKDDELHIFNLSYRGKVEEDLPIIMKAVIDSYDEYLDEQYKDVSTERVAQVRVDLKEAEVALSDATEAYRDFQKETELIYRDGEPVSKEQEVLDQLEQKLLAAKLEHDELSTELTWFREAAELPNKEEALLYIIKMLESKESNRISAMKERMKDPEIEEIELAEIAVPPVLTKPEESKEVFQLGLQLEELQTKFGEKHREVKALRRDIESWKAYHAAHNQRILDQWQAEQDAKATRRDQLSELKKKAKKAADAEGEDTPDFRQLDYVKVYQASLVEQLRRLDPKIALWTDRQRKAASEAAKLKGDFEKDRDLRDIIDRAQRDYDLLSAEYSDMSRAGNRTGFNFSRLNIGSKPSQAEPNLMKIMAISGFLGTLCGFGLGYLVEIADKTFRSPDDISTSLSLPLIGHIPVLPIQKGKLKQGSGSQLDETVVAFHRPKSRLSEAFRAVRTALYFNTQGQNNQIIQVTSPTPGDGKSTLAANLAVSIAQSGKRVLLVDADMRRPSAHFLIGLDSEIGFAQVLSGAVHVREAYHKTEVENLHFTPCGAKPNNPSELLTSQTLEETLQQMRKDFDYVIIDSPPMLAVTDPSAVAARVDGVILAIRLKKNIKVSAERTTKLLTAVNARTIGVVVNGVGAGNNYYSSYSGYSGYGGYSYNYDSMYGESSDYYSDEDEQTSEFDIA